jgi:VanZ family protein
MKKNYLKYLSFVVLLSWLYFIFSFSSEQATVSSSHSNAIVEFLSGKSVHSESVWTHYIRKSAHFVMYFVLGAIVMLNIKLNARLSTKLAILAWFFCFMYAISDEFHQLYVVGRSGQLKDVAIDSLAAAISIIVTYVFWRTHVK